MSLSMAEQIVLTTVRLECDKSGSRKSTGTGFFFAFRVDDQRVIPVLVTNKHVISESIRGTFALTLRDDSGNPLIGTHEPVSLDNFESLWIKHPDPQIDLAVFPLAPLLTAAEKHGKRFFYSPIPEDLIPDHGKASALSSIEEITMIGYPNGLWDQKNNLPIVRRGITATNPKYDYNGLPYFLIDCACFPGSSGSPVLIFNDGGHFTPSGGISIGSGRVLLLGALFAGPQHIAQGEIQTIEVPLQQTTIAMSRIPNNLGFVVKASKLLDFKPMLMTGV